MQDSKQTAEDSTAPAAPAGPPRPDDPTPAALAQQRIRDAWAERRDRELAGFMAWLDSDECPAELRESHRRGRELDRIAAERHKAETDERHRLQRAGLAPVTDDGTWESHLLWLTREFGGRQFSTGQVRMTALAHGGWVSPPGRFSPEDADFARQLGLAYAQAAHRVVGGMWLVPGGKTAGARRWLACVKEDQPALPFTTRHTLHAFPQVVQGVTGLRGQIPISHAIETPPPYPYSTCLEGE